MSCQEVGTQVCAALSTGTFDVAMINFANPDMVGHTGDLQAAIQAVESVDIQLGHLIATVQKQKGLDHEIFFLDQKITYIRYKKNNLD